MNIQVDGWKELNLHKQICFHIKIVVIDEIMEQTL